MHKKEDLRRTIQRINGKGYKAYKDVEGLYDFREYQLFFDRAQGDPRTHIGLCDTVMALNAVCSRIISIREKDRRPP